MTRSIYIELRHYSKQLRAQLNSAADKCLLCDAESTYKCLFDKTFTEIGQVYYKAHYNAQLSHEKQMRLTVEKMERELQFPPGSGRCDCSDQLGEVDRMERGEQQQKVESCDEIDQHNALWGIASPDTTPTRQDTTGVALPGAAYHQETRPCNGYDSNHQADIEKWNLSRLQTWELRDVEMKTVKENRERLKVQCHAHTMSVIHMQDRIGPQRNICFRLCTRRALA